MYWSFFDEYNNFSDVEIEELKERLNKALRTSLHIIQNHLSLQLDDPEANPDGLADLTYLLTFASECTTALEEIRRDNFTISRIILAKRAVKCLEKSIAKFNPGNSQDESSNDLSPVMN